MTHKVALIAAGGTGGHIFPGLSVAQALIKKGWHVVWAGNPKAMEGQLVPRHGIALQPLVFAGFRGKNFLAQAWMPLGLLKALWRSVRILRAVKPDVVLGMGGYVALPMGLAARMLGVPLVVHEQNSVAGLSNKILSKLSSQNLVGFPNALSDALWVGNPVREDVMNQARPAERFASRSGPLQLLVVGGSLGAQALNTVLPQALALLPKTLDVHVLHQAGEKHLDALRSNYRALGLEVRTVAFVEDMATALSEADLVICRSGAMTVAEISAMGVAALFIPFPFAVDDHQTHNATFLVRQGAAWLKQQSELDPAWLAAWLEKIDRAQCEKTATKAWELSKRQATEDVVANIERIVKA